MEKTLVATLEGPLGKAEIYEVPQANADGGLQLQYEVLFNGQTETYRALGEAYLEAGESASAVPHLEESLARWTEYEYGPLIALFTGWLGDARPKS